MSKNKSLSTLALTMLVVSLGLGGCSTTGNQLAGLSADTQKSFPAYSVHLNSHTPSADSSDSDFDGKVDDDLWTHLRDGFLLLSDELPVSVQQHIRWYQRNPSYLETVFNRSEPFIAFVVDELDRAGFPLELALLPIVESSYDPFAYSHSHAVGLWQFIPSTGKAYGLEQDRWYDGRRDIIDSTQAAISYLSYLQERFNGDWLLALAAYNSGEGTVSRAIAKNLKAGKGTDFWSLSLPRETRNYVPQLMALAAIVNDPESYGVTLPQMGKSLYFEIVEIESQINLHQVVKLSEVEPELFTRLNPAYRRSITPPQGKFNLLLPSGSAEPLREFIATTDPREWVPYTEYPVRSGDTLSRIASDFGVPIGWIRQGNQLRNDRLQIGQILMIPNSGDDLDSLRGGTAGIREQRYTVRNGDSLWTIAQRFGTSVKEIKRANGLRNDSLRPGDRLMIAMAKSSKQQSRADTIRKTSYKVRRGDSLYLIAKKFDVAVGDITRWNRLSRSEYLQPGQSLTLFINPLKL